MTVSVIITTFNRPNKVINAIDSVLNQKHQAQEIIVVNDGDILEGFDYHIIFNHIILINNIDSRGANFSRNRGASLATGDILMFLDDDDTWESKKIKNQLRIFKDSPQVGLVYSNRNVVDDSGKLLRTIHSTKSGCLYPDILFKNLIGTTSSVAIKRDIFNFVGGFDVNLPALQDYDVWIRVCKVCLIGLDTEFTVNYTSSSNSILQLSGSAFKKIAAVNYIKDKYSMEILNLSFIQRCKVYSSLQLSISRSYRGTSYYKSALYAVKSFLYYPNFKALFFLLPRFFIKI